MSRSHLILLVIGLLCSPLAAAPATQPAAEKLEQRLPEVQLEGRTLRQVLMTVADQTRLNIVPDWSALADLGVDHDIKLHGRLSDVTVRQAILLALSDAGATRVEELLIDDHNILRLGRAPKVITRVYPVGKLVDRETARLAPTTMPAEDKHDIAFTAIMKALTTTIDPDSWRDAGGMVGAMSYLGRNLIVTQTPETQAKVEQLLRTLIEGEKETPHAP